MNDPNFINLYAIYDKLAESSFPIFEAPNHGTAARSAIEIYKRNNLDYKEFDLRFVGIFDKSTGNISINRDFEPYNINYAIERIRKGMEVIDG